VTNTIFFINIDLHNQTYSNCKRWNSAISDTPVQLLVSGSLSDMVIGQRFKNNNPIRRWDGQELKHRFVDAATRANQLIG